MIKLQVLKYAIYNTGILSPKLPPINWNILHNVEATIWSKESVWPQVIVIDKIIQNAVE